MFVREFFQQLTAILLGALLLGVLWTALTFVAIWACLDGDAVNWVLALRDPLRLIPIAAFTLGVLFMAALSIAMVAIAIDYWEDREFDAVVVTSILAVPQSCLSAFALFLLGSFLTGMY